LRIHLKKIAPNQSQFIKLFFNLAPNAEAVIILDHADAAGFSNVMIHTTLGSRAKLTFLNHCHSQQQPICFVHHEVEQHAASEYNDCSLSLKAQWLRYELNVHLQESHARCDLTGLYFGVQQECVDHHLCVHHHAPHCQSVQFYKGVLNDEAKAVFNGKVVVAAGAQKTHAKQKNNNILLSKTAEINTKPELEIDADDVICSHGATVGALSEEALFYLLARGIAPAQAEEILITAFINEVVSKLGVIKEEVERLLKPRLKKDSLGTERVKI
jgi:Fe-S cluster assembly protein SufD